MNNEENSDSTQSKATTPETQYIFSESQIEEDQPLLTNAPRIVNPRETNMRWFALVLIFMISCGPYLCFENTQPLQYPIQQIFQIQDAEFNMLYSFALIPNVILPFIGGVIIDSFGARITLIIFCLIVTIGQCIVTVGAKIYSFEVMIIGRFIFGFGYLTIQNGIIIILAKWFMAKEYTLAWGLIKTVVRLGSALNSWLTPLIFSLTNQLYLACLFGVIMLLISCVSMLMLIHIDKKADEYSEMVSSAKPKQVFSFRDLKFLPRIYFIMLVLPVMSYGSFYCFCNNMNNILVQRFGFNTVHAGSLVTIMHIIGAVMSSPVGFMADKIGKRAILVSVGVFLLFLSQASLLILEDKPQGEPNYGIIAVFIFLGFYYAFFSTLFFASVSLVVDIKLLGTANGIISCLSSIYQGLLTETLGFIHDNSLDFHEGYFWPQVAQSGMLFFTVIFCIWMFYEDTKTGRRLDKPKVEIEKKDH